MFGLAGQGLVESMLFERAVLAQTVSRVSLKLRKEPKHLDVMLAGIGDSARVVQERSSNSSWRGEIQRSDQEVSTKEIAQQLAMPELGVASVRLRGSGSTFELELTSVAGSVLPKPKILSTGDDLVLRFQGLTNAIITRQTASLDLRRPGRVAQPMVAPAMRPRAAAPPLGDMAVGSMLINNRSFVNASGPPVSLTLNNAPAKDALMSLARLGGYGFVFVGDAKTSTDADVDRTPLQVTMAFRNERYDRALNSVLMSSGLQGRLDGKTLLVGTAVSAKSFGPQMSKVFRMNQVDVASAGQYLSNLGAVIKPTATSSVIFNGGGEGSDQDRGSGSGSASDPDAPELGPLVGLVGTTDSRLNTITLVGEPKLITVAESYLKQIDLRQRQVAVKVQILDVGLKNELDSDSSFSSRIGDAYLVSNSGRAYMNFGKYKPGSPLGTGVYDGLGYSRPGDYSPGLNEKGEQLEDEADAEGLPFDQRDVSLRYPDSSFYSYLESAIVSTNAKVIAEPTILVLEGQKSKVEAATEVATAITTVTSSDGGGEVSYETVKSNAGLTLDVELSKVDDNGFVTLSLTPEVSVPLPGGFSQGVPIFNIKKRRVESGQIRLRDRQTLILTGIIQEDDIAEAQKWPILGDLPLIGSLFRASRRTREKRELVVLVTPSIIDDEAGGVFGYGYRPVSKEARQLMSPR